MGLQAVGLPDPLHRAQADADGLGHGTAGPVGRLARRIGASEGKDLRQSCRRQRRLARLSRLVAEQSVDALFSVALLPTPHSRSAHTGAPRYLGHRQSVRRITNNPSPLNVFERPATIANNRGQTLAVLGSYDHTYVLRHGRRIAWPDSFVNPMFASVH
jgi:hypothetical protein